MKFENNKIFHNKSFGSLRKDFIEESPDFTFYRMTEEDIAILETTHFIGDNEYYRIDEVAIPKGNIIKL